MSDAFSFSNEPSPKLQHGASEDIPARLDNRGSHDLTAIDEQINGSAWTPAGREEFEARVLAYKAMLFKQCQAESDVIGGGREIALSHVSNAANRMNVQPSKTSLSVKLAKNLGSFALGISSACFVRVLNEPPIVPSSAAFWAGVALVSAVIWVIGFIKDGG